MNNWKESTIAEIGQVVSGGTPSTSVEEFWNGGEILFVTPFDLSRNNSKFIANTARKISEKGLKNSSANLLPKGSIVISSRAPIGYVAIGGVMIILQIKAAKVLFRMKNLIPNSSTII